MTDPLLDTLRTDADRLVELADGDLTAPVPTCPAWTLADLIVHLGRVHRWAASALDTAPDGEWPPFGARPADGEPLGPWLRAGLDGLVDRFDGADLDRPTWSFVGPGTVAWWLRRQTLETAMHRCDAQLAAGLTPDSIEPAVAAAGIEEWCELQSTRWFRPSDDVLMSVHLHATDQEELPDLAGEWFLEADASGLRWDHGHRKGDVAVRGRRSDLFLMVWRRLAPSDLEVLGDIERLDGFLLASAVD